MAKSTLKVIVMIMKIVPRDERMKNLCFIVIEAIKVINRYSYALINLFYFSKFTIRNVFRCIFIRFGVESYILTLSSSADFIRRG